MASEKLRGAHQNHRDMESAAATLYSPCVRGGFLALRAEEGHRILCVLRVKVFAYSPASARSTAPEAGTGARPKWSRKVVPS